jgi:DNA-binding NarL/FixJ family response regulator
MPDENTPIRIAIVDDYDLVVAGVARMFTRYSDRITVVELDANQPVTTSVDIALLDTFAQPEADGDELDVLIANPLARKVALYTWVFDQNVIDAALAKGAAGYLSKALPALDMVTSLERIHRGDTVISAAPPRRTAASQDWPGRAEGLTERESEIIALITQGKNNAEIAFITHLSPNSIKTHIRKAYKKMNVTSRTQAVRWGMYHGLNIEHRRIHDWHS